MRWVRAVFATVVLAGSGGAVSSGGPVAAATASSTTTLAVSATSVTQDSWVTLTAQVSAGGGVPSGTVTFTDVSNGSVLDTAALSNGTATLSTAALAPGARSIVAAYSGNSGVSASSSAAVSVSVAPAGSVAVAFQEDARHDGQQTRGALSAGSLVKKWSRTLGGTPAIAGQGMISYPVIAGGRVFVTALRGGYQLYALNASTGATDWYVGLGSATQLNGLAYDGQRIFVLDSSGLVTAYVASTGRELWVSQMPYMYSFTAAPTAYDGVIYVSGQGYGGRAYEVSEADGRVRMDTMVDGGASTPAVDDTGMYVSYSGQQDYRFGLGGQLVWRYAGCCSGGAGTMPVLHGSYVYARGEPPADTPVILSKSSGTNVGGFVSDTAPDFDSTNMYTVQGGNLVAVSPSGSPNRWTFKNGSLVSAPVVNNGVIYVGGNNGTVYGMSASTGAKVWSAAAGPYMASPADSTGILIGMAIGGGFLIVPAGNVLTAFGN